MNNLLQRIITGVLGSAFMLVAIWFSFTSFVLLFFLINFLSCLEYHQLLKKSNIGTNAWAGIGGGVLVYSLFVLNSSEFTFLIIPNTLVIAIPCILFMVYMLIELFSENAQPITRVAYTIAGILYISVPFGLLTLIPWEITDSNSDIDISVYKFEIIYAILFLIWANDVGAYFIGKFLGKHKLFERISPKKTWEGSIGGLLFSILFTFLLYETFGIYSIPKWMGLCVIVVVTGSLGDLVESMIKRTLQVKDSGTLLPGHGGFLDRFDALIFAIPFVFLYLTIFQ